MPIVHTVAFKAKEGQDDALAKASDHFFAELKAGKVPGITPIYFGKIHYNLDRCAPFDRSEYGMGQSDGRQRDCLAGGASRS